MRRFIIVYVLMFLFGLSFVSCSNDDTDENQKEQPVTCLVDAYDKLVPQYGNYYRIFVYDMMNDDKSTTIYEIGTTLNILTSDINIVTNITHTYPDWYEDNLGIGYKLNDDAVEFSEDGGILVYCRCKDHVQKAYNIYERHKTSETIELCE